MSRSMETSASVSRSESCLAQNDLRKYLKEEPSRHVCARTWVQKVYSFRLHDIIYDENAYDRVTPGFQEEVESREYLEFTQYLKTIPHDHNVFFDWLDMLVVDEALVERTRREISHYSINQKSQDIRATYTEKKTPTELALTKFPCDEKYFFEAENESWERGKSESPLNLSVGFLDVNLVEEACYGPKRFYVTLFNGPRPHEKFSEQFRSYVHWCDRKKFSLRVPYKERLIVYYDERRRQNKYSSLIVVKNNPEEPFLLVYETETGKIMSIPRTDAERCLRALTSTALKFFIRPSSIPVELVDDVTPEEWEKFLKDVKENGKLYVTEVNGHKLKVARYEKVVPGRDADKPYCRNLYCLGKCAIPDEWRKPPRFSHCQNVSEGRSFNH